MPRRPEKDWFDGPDPVAALFAWFMLAGLGVVVAAVLAAAISCPDPVRVDTGAPSEDKPK